MGEVWRGVHTRQDIPVAFKVMTGSRARQRRYRDAFRNEVRAVAALNHPGIVKVFDHGMVTPEAEELSGGRLVAGSPYLVMELASRGSLDQMRGVLAWADLKRILITLMDALAHAHARGVIHRDIKPGNILMASEDDLRPGLKLTDFGLAHATDETETQMKGSKAGTPRYMAPELFEGQWRDYGPWSDLYALGCLAFELSTNRPLFGADNYQDLKRQHLYELPPALEPLQPVPEGFDQWIVRLVQKKAHERFVRAADAAWALMRLGDPADDRKSSLAIDFSMSTSRATNMFSTVSGMNPTSTLMFPDMPPGMSDRSTILFPEEGLSQHSTYLYDGTFAGADTYMVPEAGLGGARTFLLDELLRQAPSTSRGRRPQGQATDVEPLEVTPSPHPLTWRRDTPADPTVGMIGAGLRLFALRTYRMVGRERERDTIWDALTEVRKTGRARLVLLNGAAGYGKSRLTEWICERGHEVGSATLMKAGHSPIAGPANGLPRMVSRYLNNIGLNRADVRRRTRKSLQDSEVTDDYEWDALTELVMAPMAEERAARAKPIRFSSPTERYVLLQRLIEREGRKRPVIVWIDDVQWGSDALWFAQYVLKSQTLRATPVLFILTARDEALAERPVEAHILQQIMEQEGTQRIQIGPLPEVEREELVRELLLLEGDLAHQVAERCRGNPLFAVQLVGDWVQRGVLEVGEHGFVLKEGEQARLPDDLHQVWTGRIARLLEEEPPDSGPALEIAALLGQEVDSLEWEQACAEAGVELTFHLYYKLLSSRLAEHGNATWSFTHGMLRECLERNARDYDRWQHLHRSCARMLAKRYPRAQQGVSERLGRHLLAAGDRAQAVAPLLRGASEHIESSEFRIADELVRLREEALTELGIDEANPAWGEGWILQIQLGYLRGELVTAMDLGQRCIDAARTHGWARLLPDALIWTGQVALIRGDLDRATRHFEAARELTEQSGDARRKIDCVRGLGEVAFKRGQVEGAMELLRTALVEAKGLKERRRVADCLQALRPVVAMKGDIELAVDLIKQAHALHDRVGNRHGVGECLYGLGELAMAEEQLEKGSSYYQRALTLFDRLGAQGGIASCLLGLAEVDRRRSRHVQAEQRYRRVLSLHEATGGGEGIRPRLGLGMVLMDQGRYLEAAEVLAEARALADREGRRGLLGAVYLNLLRCAGRQRDWKAWEVHMEGVCELLGETNVVDADLARYARDAGHAAAQGDADVRAAEAYAIAIVQFLALSMDAEVETCRRERRGLRLPADEAARFKVCPRCLRRFEGEFNFCTEDGGGLVLLGAPRPAASMPPSLPPALPPGAVSQGLRAVPRPAPSSSQSLPPIPRPPRPPDPE